MNWITIEEVIVIHDEVISETGGPDGLINPAGLESALERPLTCVFGRYLFPDLYSKVGALIHSMIAFHPFVDGNKRTSLVIADVVLKLNGQRLIPSDNVESFFRSVAAGEHDVPDITAWLSKNTEPLKSNPL